MVWSLKNLENFLVENGVDISKWGRGEAKTLNHLLQELVKGECEIEIKDGKVLRIVHALSINVIYKGEILKEEYQRFKDGRIRRRKMDCSVAEKIHEDEIKDLNQAVKRALSEELKVKDISDEQIKELPKIHRTRASGSYPGTNMDMVLYKFDVLLKYHQYNPHGYVEHQKDKDTYFVWIQNKHLKKSGWGKLHEEVRLTKAAYSRQKKELLDISDLKRKIKEIELVLSDVGCQVTYTTTPYISGYFTLTLTIRTYDVNFSQFTHLKYPPREEYDEFKDRLWDICESKGYKCETKGKFGTYIEISKISTTLSTQKPLPHIDSPYLVVENKKKANSLIKVRDELKSITHIMSDVGVKTQAYISRSEANGEFIFLKLLKNDKVYGWIGSTLIYDFEEYEEFKDRLDEICQSNGLVCVEPPRYYGSFLLIGNPSFNMEVYLSKDMYKITYSDHNRILEGLDHHGMKNLIKICNEIKTITHILTDVGFKVKAGIYYDSVKIGFYILIEISKWIPGSIFPRPIRGGHWDTNFDTNTDTEGIAEYDEFRDRLSEICKDLYICCNKSGKILVSMDPTVSDRIYIQKDSKDYIPIIKES